MKQIYNNNYLRKSLRDNMNSMIDNIEQMEGMKKIVRDKFGLEEGVNYEMVLRNLKQTIEILDIQVNSKNE